MELIPIVYTALFIVAALTLVVILSSYISYRVKVRNGTVDKPSIDVPAHHQNPIKKAVQRITKPIMYPEFQKEKLSSNKPVEKSTHPQEKSVPIKKTEKKIEPKEKIKDPVNRIEVLNSNRSLIKEIVEPKIDIPAKLVQDDKKLKTLGDDVLDKYSDDKNDGMFTLNVKNNKNDKKN